MASFKVDNPNSSLTYIKASSVCYKAVDMFRKFGLLQKYCREQGHIAPLRPSRIWKPRANLSSSGVKRVMEQNRRIFDVNVTRSEILLAGVSLPFTA